MCGASAYTLSSQVLCCMAIPDITVADRATEERVFFDCKHFHLLCTLFILSLPMSRPHYSFFACLIFIAMEYRLTTKKILI